MTLKILLNRFRQGESQSADGGKKIGDRTTKTMRVLRMPISQPLDAAPQQN